MFMTAGCAAYDHIETRYRSSKLTQRAKKVFSVGYNSHNHTWRLWDPTDETRITQSTEVSFRERSSRDVELLLQDERPRSPVLMDDVYPMSTTEQYEEADTGTSEVRPEGNYRHGGSN